MATPCPIDMSTKIDFLDAVKASRKADLKHLEKLETQGKDIVGERTKQRKAFKEANKEISDLLESEKCLGYVFGTGGRDRVYVDQSTDCKTPMDWGVIKPLNDDIVTKSFGELNKVCHSSWCTFAS